MLKVNSSIVLTKVFILFLLLLAGFVARRLKIFDNTTTRGLNNIILKVTLPALTIVSMQMNYNTSLLVESAQLLFISISVYAASFFIALIIPFILKPHNGERGVFQFVTIFSNVAFMGFPVIKSVFGESALFYAAIYNLPFNFLTFTLGVILLLQDKVFSSTSEPGNGYRISINQILNPGVVSVILGFALFVLNIRLPQIIKEPMELLGNITIPMSMFVIGAILAQNSIIKAFTNWRLYILTALRLLILPCILWLILRNFIDNKVFLGVIVLICGMPAAASTPILAQAYGGNYETAAQSVFLSTMLSIFTIPLLALILV